MRFQSNFIAIEFGRPACCTSRYPVGNAIDDVRVLVQNGLVPDVDSTGYVFTMAAHLAFHDAAKSGPLREAPDVDDALFVTKPGRPMLTRSNSPTARPQADEDDYAY